MVSRVILKLVKNHRPWIFTRGCTTNYLAELRNIIPEDIRYDPNKTALTLLTHGSEEMSAAIITDIMGRAGIRMAIAGLGGYEPLRCSNRIVIKPTTTLEETVSSGLPYDVIFVPGGYKGIISLCQNSLVGELLKMQDDNKRYIACCNFACIVLAHFNIAKGKKITASLQAEQYFGKHFIFLKNAPITMDGHIISIRSPINTVRMALGLVELMNGLETAQTVAGRLMYNYSTIYKKTTRDMNSAIPKTIPSREDPEGWNKEFDRNLQKGIENIEFFSIFVRGSKTKISSKNPKKKDGGGGLGGSGHKSEADQIKKLIKESGRKFPTLKDSDTLHKARYPEKAEPIVANEESDDESKKNLTIVKDIFEDKQQIRQKNKNDSAAKTKSSKQKHDNNASENEFSKNKKDEKLVKKTLLQRLQECIKGGESAEECKRKEDKKIKKISNDQKKFDHTKTESSVKKKANGVISDKKASESAKSAEDKDEKAKKIVKPTIEKDAKPKDFEKDKFKQPEDVIKPMKEKTRHEEADEAKKEIGKKEKKDKLTKMQKPLKLAEEKRIKTQVDGKEIKDEKNEDTFIKQIEEDVHDVADDQLDDKLIMEEYSKIKYGDDKDAIKTIDSNDEKVETKEVDVMKKSSEKSAKEAAESKDTLSSDPEPQLDNEIKLPASYSKKKRYVEAFDRAAERCEKAITEEHERMEKEHANIDEYENLKKERNEAEFGEKIIKKEQEKINKEWQDIQKAQRREKQKTADEKDKSEEKKGQTKSNKPEKEIRTNIKDGSVVNEEVDKSEKIAETVRLPIHSTSKLADTQKAAENIRKLKRIIRNLERFTTLSRPSQKRTTEKEKYLQKQKNALKSISTMRDKLDKQQTEQISRRNESMKGRTANTDAAANLTINEDVMDPSDKRAAKKKKENSPKNVQSEKQRGALKQIKKKMPSEETNDKDNKKKK